MRGQRIKQTIRMEVMTQDRSNDTICPNCGVEISRSTVIRTHKNRERNRRCNECDHVYYTEETILSSKMIKLRMENDNLRKRIKEYEASIF